MKLAHRLLMITVACVSVVSMHSNQDVQYVQAKKASIRDRKPITVKIVTKDGKEISKDTFKNTSSKTKGKSKLFFDWTYSPNTIEVYQDGLLKKTIDLDQATAPTFFPEIIIDENLNIEVRAKP